MTIEVAKYYKTRLGEKAYAVTTEDMLTIPADMNQSPFEETILMVTSDSSWYSFLDGRHIEHGTSTFDITEEWSDTDWYAVPVDQPVEVKNEGDPVFKAAYFANIKEDIRGKIYMVFKNGKTYREARGETEEFTMCNLV